jgi:hypothetical protein
MGESTYLGKWTKEEYQNQREKYGAASFVKEILQYRDEEWTSRFWTIWIGGLLGRPATMCERKMVLDSVAFWNYADCLLDGLNGPPGQDDLDQANEKLRKVIARLEPELVILMSNRLSSNLFRGKDNFAMNPTPEHRKVWKGCVEGVEFSFLSINHPRGFREEDRVAIRDAIEGLGGHQPGRQRFFRNCATMPPKCPDDQTDCAGEKGEKPPKDQDDEPSLSGRQIWHTRLDLILDADDPHATNAIKHLLTYFVWSWLEKSAGPETAKGTDDQTSPKL